MSNKIEACLCIPCGIALADLFEVTPIADASAKKTVCPWCQKEHVFFKYRISDRRI
ncbi:MAG: hypothetical protein IJI06_08760 [Oscillospiraceae bacterium]|nr:hypothetical protein [Oscillospiraceae bacterium]